MHKENLYKFFQFVAAVLLILFFVRVGMDFFNGEEADVFRMLLAGRAVQFLLPSILAWVASIVAHKKYNK